MDRNLETGHSELASALRGRMLALAQDRRPLSVAGAHQIGRELATYCVFVRERLAELVNDGPPLIGILLNGEKQLWVGDVCHTMLPGDAFVFPSRRKMTVVNVPDERTNRYESLLIEVSEPALLMRAAAVVANPRRAIDLAPRLRLTTEIVDALVHVASLRAGAEDAGELARHRLSEVLMLIADQPAAAPLFETDIRSAVEGMVLSAPTRAWTAQSLGAAMHMGGSTLRRRLEADGTSLRAVLQQARMSVARQLLASGAANASQAAEAAGYASRSHFARAFRNIYGVTPREAGRALDQQ